MKDQNTDNSLKTLAKIAKNNPRLVPLIKAASDSAFNCDMAKLPASAFADSCNRKFPINTKESAVLSYLYASEQRANGSLLEKISEALDLFNIKPPKLEDQHLLGNSVFLFPEEQRYPVNTDTEIKIAAAYFDDYGHQFSIDERRKYCHSLVKEASIRKIPSETFSSTIKQYAGVVCVDTDKLAMEIENRLALCNSRMADSPVADYIKTSYEKLAASFSKMKRIVYNGCSDFEKVAAVINHIDEEANLRSHYGESISDPYLAVFNTTKLAEASIKIDSTEIPYSRLFRLSTADYRDILGSDFFDEVSDGGQLNPERFKVVVDTLPLDMKRELLIRLRQV